MVAVTTKTACSRGTEAGGRSHAPEATQGGPTGGRVEPDSGWRLSVSRGPLGDKGLCPMKETDVHSINLNATLD